MFFTRLHRCRCLLSLLSWLLSAKEGQREKKSQKKKSMHVWLTCCMLHTRQKLGFCLSSASTISHVHMHAIRWATAPMPLFFFFLFSRLGRALLGGFWMGCVRGRIGCTERRIDGEVDGLIYWLSFPFLSFPSLSPSFPSLPFLSFPLHTYMNGNCVITSKERWWKEGRKEWELRNHVGRKKGLIWYMEMNG